MLREALVSERAARGERARDLVVLFHAVTTGLLILVLATLALLGVTGLARLDALAARLDALGAAACGR